MIFFRKALPLKLSSRGSGRDIGQRWWLVMKHPRRAAQKKLDYPAETPGSRLAAKARKLASKLTSEQRREHFDEAMTMIYGGAPGPSTAGLSSLPEG
jgi:hypothetical protein